MDQASTESTESAKDAPLVRAPAGRLGASAVFVGDMVYGGHARDQEADRRGPSLAFARPAHAREVPGVLRICANAGISLAPRGDHACTVVLAQHSSAPLLEGRSDPARAKAAQVPGGLPFRRELPAGKFGALDRRSSMNPVCLIAASETRG